VPIQKFEAEREVQLICRDDFWAGMIMKRSRVFRQDNDAKSAKHIVKYLLNRKPLDQTGAGGEVDRQLAA
jgi:hypothetical protein